MRAVIVHQFGAPDSFVIEEREDPRPSAGQVRIATAVAGLSYVDVLVSAGKYQIKPPLPYIPGSEIAGVIDAVGTGVSNSRIGQRVLALAPGTALAEHAIIAAESAVPIPDSMTFEEAAVFQISYATAYYALVQRAMVKPGERVLVIGAGGAVGFAAIEVAKALGAIVIASASTNEKRALALEGGADVALDSRSENWRAEIKAASGGNGIDVVVDPVAGPTMEAAFRSLRWQGRHLVVGFASGEIPSLRVNLPLIKGASLIGVDLRQAMEVDPALQGRLLQQLFDLFGRGLARPRVMHCYPLEQFAAAMTMVASGSASGRTVIRISRST
jgi:NADPH:quinone reductase